jgi:YidC/Oxa1 family membrane protein insertase
VSAPTSPATPPAETPITPAVTPAPAVTAADTVPASTVAADTVLVRAPLYEYAISSLGGALVGARLLQYEVQPPRDGEVVQLSPEEFPGLLSYRLRVGTRDVDLSRLPFDIVPRQDVITMSEGQGPTTLTLQHSSDQLRVTLTYTFDASRYVADVRMVVSGLGDQVPTLYMQLPRTLRMNEAVPEEDERALAYVVNSSVGGINNFRLSSLKEARTENGPLSWVAVKSKYFVVAALVHPESQRPFGGLIAQPIPEQPNAASLTATLLPGDDGTFAFRVYAGPLEPQRLADLGYKFDDVNPFGFRIFRPILGPLGHGISWVLYGMHDVLGLGYGWVLILFGVLIRVLLWPLNAKAMRSQMKNMEIQPKLKEIQTKYKNEPEKLQKEMLRLYKEEGFNPMGGCLPMLIPLPILITLFFVFQSTIAFRGVEFLWLPDLSRADPLYILPVLLGLSMFLMQWLSSRGGMMDQNPQMKFLMYFMPIFMTVIFLNFASGLNLYYAAMNFASIPQQLQISRERRRMQAARGLSTA